MIPLPLVLCLSVAALLVTLSDPPARGAPPALLPAPPRPAADAPSPAARVTAHYVETARTRYLAAFDAARELLTATLALDHAPSAETHAAAKRAWIHAHRVYSRCEVFRFGNPNVDAWEEDVNAWPMDEGLIDYVADGYVFHEGNPHALENIVVHGRTPITDEIIGEFQAGANPKAAPDSSISDIETNVTRGFHAIEFLLWGQDLNVPRDAAGQRPHTDYARDDDCTNERCDRRRQFLSAATRLLIQDLQFAVLDWDPAGALYAKRFGALPVAEQLDRMIVGMGTLCFGEVANERIQVALITGDQEEEQSCFSDTTHLALAENLRSVESLYLGRSVRGDGSEHVGPSLAELTAQLDPRLDARLRVAFAQTEALVQRLLALGDGGAPFDMLIQPDHAEGQELLGALIAQLFAQTEVIEELRARIPELVAL